MATQDVIGILPVALEQIELLRARMASATNEPEPPNVLPQAPRFPTSMLHVPAHRGG